MNITYYKATIADIDLLTETRLEVQRAANQLTAETDMSEIEAETYRYYKESLETEDHIAYLVFNNDEFIGAGGISFFQVMPTYYNVTGKKAYIMNMYTKHEYRRKGIAKKVLDLLVDEAKSRNLQWLSLEATAMGRPLYENYGFVMMESEMELGLTQ